MGARSGREYLAGLREQEREVWLGGERVRDVTTHPGLKGGARAIASLYDMQLDPKLGDRMTYVSPSSGDRVGLSFIIPRTREDLERRSAMMLNWARATCGMMGRSPDFMNVTYAAWAGAAEFFAQGRPEFGENMRPLLRIHPRKRPDLDPRADQSAAQPQRLGRLQSAGGNRARSRARNRCRDRRAWGSHSGDPRAARRRDRGLFAANGAPQRKPQPVRAELFDPVRGTRGSNSCAATASTSAARISTSPWARALRRWIASSFSTMCWCRGSGCSCSTMSTGSTRPPHVTHSSAHSAHQGAAKNLAKCEFVLGRALLMTQALGNAPSAAYRGADRRIDADHRADARVHARRRGRCRTRPLGGHVPRPAAGRKHAQPDHERLSADDRDPAAVWGRAAFC